MNSQVQAGFPARPVLENPDSLSGPSICEFEKDAPTGDHGAQAVVPSFLSVPPIDGAEARKFLASIARSSEDTSFVFQVFDDNESRKDGRLAQTISGAFEECEDRLNKAARSGCGIFVTPNVSCNGRREAKDIVDTRAVFADDDLGLLSLELLPIPPSAVVQSARGIHPYWRLAPGASLERWADLQVGIIETLGTDSKIKDLPRVMRLPGSYHQKGVPTKVTLASANPERIYTPAEIRAAFPRKAEAPARPSNFKRTPLESGEKGRLSRSTQDFLVNGALEGEWNIRLFKAAKDLQEQLYSEAEAIEHLMTVDGYLDSGSLGTISSAYKTAPRYEPRGHDFVVDTPTNLGPDDSQSEVTEEGGRQ